MIRRAHRLAALALSAMLAAGVAAVPGPANAAAPANRTWAVRALTSYQAMQQHLYQGDTEHGLYQENYPVQANDPAHSYAWTLREATAATVSLSEIPGLGQRLRPDVAQRYSALELYRVETPGHAGYESYLPPPLGAGGDLFYDDNAVIGLELVRGYEADHSAVLLRRAVNTFSTITRGWDTSADHPCPGGMMWFDSPANNIRAANVTGLGAELAAHLYLITHEKDYLGWSRKLYDWNRTCLQQSPGLYWNDIGYDGTIDKTLWTYNTGAMVGAAALLYQSTGDQHYLAEATTGAAKGLDYWTMGDNLYNQPAIFNAILFNNLLLLDSYVPNPRYRRVIEQYAGREWQSNRDPATGLFHFQPGGGGADNPTGPAQTLEQSAMIQVFAALAWPTAEYRRIA